MHFPCGQGIGFVITATGVTPDIVLVGFVSRSGFSNSILFDGREIRILIRLGIFSGLCFFTNESLNLRTSSLVFGFFFSISWPTNFGKFMFVYKKEIFKSCLFLKRLQASWVVSPYLFRKWAIWRNECLIEA